MKKLKYAENYKKIRRSNETLEQLYNIWNKYIQTLVIVFIVTFLIFLVILCMVHIQSSRQKLRHRHKYESGVIEYDNNLENPIEIHGDPTYSEIEAGLLNLPNITVTTKPCKRTDGAGEVAITCSGYDSLDDLIEDINTNFKTRENVYLTMSNIHFGRKVPRKDWLQEVNVRITKLSLRETINLEDLGDGSFSGKPFDLKYLTIEQSDIREMRKEAFSGNVLMNTLEIRNNQMKPIKFEAGVLEYVRDYLTSLQIQNCISSVKDLSNIMGSNASHFCCLQMVDLRQNNLGKLDKNSLSSITKVETLSLDSCNIESIELDTFAYLRNLKSLSLDDNALTYLPDGIFGNQITKVNLQNNDWVCNCELNWLKEQYTKLRIFVRPLMCGSKKFEEVDFCPTTSSSSSSQTRTASSNTETTHSSMPTYSTTHTTRRSTNSKTTTSPVTAASTTTTSSTYETSNPVPSTSRTSESITSSSTSVASSTTSATTISTTHHSPTYHTSSDGTTVTNTPATEGPNFKIIECFKAEQINYVNFDTAHRVSIRQGKISFLFQQSDDSIPSYSVSIVGNLPNNSSLLIQDPNTNDISCLEMSSHNFKINSLVNSKTYSLCLLEEERNDVSPYDCTAISIPPKYDNRAWIPNHQKQYVIIGLTFGILLSIALTGVTVFLCIRHHPKLIKGNKRVIIVKNKPVEGLVMPRNSDYHQYGPSSAIRSISDGYLTPRGMRSERYYEMPLTPMSARTSHSNIRYPSPKPVRRTSLTRRRNSSYNFENIYETPPPLPPNHPKDQRNIYGGSMSSSRYSRSNHFVM